MFALFVSLIDCTQEGNADESSFTKFQANYYEINEYLEKEASQTEDSDQIMAKASEWLNSIKSHSGAHQKHGHLVEPLELFTSMSRLADQDTCNFQGYLVLANNYQALSNLVRYGIRKIDRVAKAIVRRHVQLCASVYPQTYLTKVNQIDADTISRVQAFARSIIDFNLRKGRLGQSLGKHIKSIKEALQASPMSFIYLIGRDEQDSRDETADVCRMAELLETYMDDPKRQFNKEEVPRYFQDYIVGPCEKYAAQIGPDVYLPAEWDARIRLDERLGRLDDGPMEYRLGMAYYRACEAYVLGKKVNRSKLVETMLDC